MSDPCKGFDANEGRKAFPLRSRRGKASPPPVTCTAQAEEGQLEIIMVATVFFLGLIFFAAVAHSTRHYKAQQTAWNSAVERAAQAKEKERAEIIRHVKDALAADGFIVRGNAAAKGAWHPAPVDPQPAPAVAQPAPAAAQGKAAPVHPLQEGTGRVIFLGETREAGSNYDIFTCRLLGKDGDVVEFKGAQLKGAGLRLGDLVTIHRMPSESITRPDGSTRRKNRFEVTKVAEEPVKESDDTPMQGGESGM